MKTKIHGWCEAPPVREYEVSGTCVCECAFVVRIHVRHEIQAVHCPVCGEPQILSTDVECARLAVVPIVWD